MKDVIAELKERLKNQVNEAEEIARRELEQMEYGSLSFSFILSIF
jgi:vacuolar-type H+-ATPase subunit H